MSKLWLSFLTILISLNVYCQTKITGVVKSSVDESLMYDANVTLKGSSESVKSDRIGYFQFINIPNGIYTVEVSKEGYDTYEQKITVKDQKVIDLGDLFLTYDPQSIDMGVITLTVDELSSDESSSQSSVGLLQSSKDVFAKSAAYELGAYWFRTRGYDNKYRDVYFNGIRMNKIDDGRVDFGNWGGLNDITRRPAEVTYGIEPSDYTFGGLGGVTYIDSRPSVLRTGTSFSYSLTNRSYRQRLMLTHNTGLNAKGWGVTVSGSRRWANEGRIPGTFYDAWGYYLGIEKRLNNKHTLLLSAFGAPNRRGSNSPNTQEAYDLMGTNYNSYWGYQDGKQRNERVRKTFEPVFSLTHFWNISDQSRLTTTLGYQTGKNARSRLDYSGADNPSPVYYRNMPSFNYSNLSEKIVAEREWRKDENKHQIDWVELYRQNLRRNGRAKYFLANDVNEDNTLTFNTNYRNQVSNAFTLYANLSYQNTKSNLYRDVKDLLGAKYVLDKDDYADKGQSGDFNTDNPNRKAYEGDKIEYNYNIHHDKVDGYLAGNYKAGDLDLTLGAKVSNTRIQREGIFNHYRYEDSKGKSKEYNFLDYGVKMNATYKINGRNYLVLNGTYFTAAPTANELFPRQRENNISIPDLESAKILSGDLNYVLRAPRVKARATAFYSSTKDEVQTTFAFFERDSYARDDDAKLFGAEVLKGVDKEYLGTELALEAQVTSTLTLSGVASVGQYIYKNNPDLYYFSDVYSNDKGYEQKGKAYLKNYHLSSSPQKALSIGFQYRSPDYWWIGATGNYLADNYISISPSRRTKDFFNGVRYTEDVYDNARKLLTQEKFDTVFVLNANAGKSFKFGRYYMGISLSVNNLLDNKKYITGGFEQGRLANYKALNDPERRKTFGNKYWYDQGISYFLNMYLRF